MKKEDIIKGIELVRKTGMTNMLDRENVIIILKELGYDNIANYLEKNKKEYLELLMSSNKY